MIQLSSLLNGAWQVGEGAGQVLVNPATEAAVATCSTRGLDLGAAVRFAREVGGPALRVLSFAQRGELLKAMSRALHEAREELLDLSAANNGTTRGDGKFDIDGATGTLASYARLGATLGDKRFLLDGEAEKLGGGARYVGQHVLLPRPGVAVHINAFNFPGWGAFEKIAVAILSGVPVISKPATSTALTTWRMFQIIDSKGILPAGALSLLTGPVGDLLDHLGPQDLIAFTGSANTGAVLRASSAVVERGVRLTIEADSLNSAVIAPDVEEGSEVWHAALRNLRTDIVQKTGQKCTAVRRIFVPEALVPALSAALVEELERVVVGDPSDEGVGMGPVATANQLRDVRAGIALLSAEAELLTGGAAPLDGRGVEAGQGYFVRPTLLLAKPGAAAVHDHEVFGPCATLIPYSGEATEAAALVARGQGSLVSSVYGSDRDWLWSFLSGAAPWNGRVVVASDKVVDQVLPPGMVLPNQVHGGPGRAGGGEELGGLRGLSFYHNRVAIQGDKGELRKILGE